VRRQRGRQVAPCGHTSTVGQRFLRLVHAGVTALPLPTVGLVSGRDRSP
jgi:hypothetical protein